MTPHTRKYLVCYSQSGSTIYPQITVKSNEQECHKIDLGRRQ